MIIITMLKCKYFPLDSSYLKTVVFPYFEIHSNIFVKKIPVHPKSVIVERGFV